MALENLVRPSGNQPNRYRDYAGQDRAWTDEFEQAKRKMKKYGQPMGPASIRLFGRFLGK